MTAAAALVLERGMEIVLVWSGAVRRRKGLWGIDLRNILITWRLAAKYCWLDLYTGGLTSECKGKKRLLRGAAAADYQESDPVIPRSSDWGF